MVRSRSHVDLLVLVGGYAAVDDLGRVGVDWVAGVVVEGGNWGVKWGLA